MQKALLVSQKRGAKTLHKILPFLSSGMLGIVTKVYQSLHSCLSKEMDELCPKQNRWPETGTAELNSHSLTNKLFNLASRHIFFFFVLPLFPFVQSSPSYPFHLTQTYSRLPSRKIFLPNRELSYFLPTFSRPRLSTPSPKALFLSKCPDRNFWTSQALRCVSFAKLSFQPLISDTFSLVTASSHHTSATTSGKCFRPR